MIETDAAVPGRTVDLVPVALDRSVTGRAVTQVRYGEVEVVFCDRAAFIERDGFWVQGGATTEIVVTGQPGATSVNLELTNGPNQNGVRITRGSASDDVKLGPAESRVVSVPLTSDGSAHVRITSLEGFRPSSVGSGGDERYLGVWAKVVGAGPEARPAAATK